MAVVPSPVLRLAILQFAPRLRDPAANLARIAEAAASASPDILLTPELSATGYDLGDDVARFAVPITIGERLTLPDGASTPATWDPGLWMADGTSPPANPRMHVVLGLVEKDAGGIVCNCAAVLHEGVVRHTHRKLYLPTYGMFDEARHFGRGTDLGLWEAGAGWRVGILVCEDFWHPGLTYALASAGMNLLLVLAAAPGRGVWEGGEDGGLFASADVWERIARTTAQLYGIYVALGNRVGVEGGVTFAGGSLVVGPTGDVMGRCGHTGEEILDVEVSLAEIERARRPYAHARDDDPRLVSRLLQRIG